MRSLNYGKENTDAEMKMGKPIPEASFTEHHTARFCFAVKMPNKLSFVFKLLKIFIHHIGISFEVCHHGFNNFYIKFVQSHFR